MKQEKQKLIDRLLEQVLEINLLDDIYKVSISKSCYNKLLTEYRYLFRVNGSTLNDIESFFGVTFSVDELEDGQEFKILTEV